jgi:signal transduction histidine kinase
MNATQAMRDTSPNRRDLRVSVEEDGNRIRVEVEDSGPGIPEGDRARLFDAFFTTKADGLGLGLSICRSIVDQHGGEIDYQNLAAGTRFVFSLPAAEEKPRSSAPGGDRSAS